MSVIVVLQIEVVIALATLASCAVIIVVVGNVVPIIDLVAAIDVCMVAAILAVLVEAWVVGAEPVGQITPLTVVGSGDTVAALLGPFRVSVSPTIVCNVFAGVFLVLIVHNVNRLLSRPINEAFR